MKYPDQFTKRGTRVVYNDPWGGSQYENGLAQQHLSAGCMYTLDWVDENGRVWLVELTGGTGIGSRPFFYRKQFEIWSPEMGSAPYDSRYVRTEKGSLVRPEDWNSAVVFTYKPPKVKLGKKKPKKTTPKPIVMPDEGARFEGL